MWTPNNNTNVPVWFKDDRVIGNPAFDEQGHYRDPSVQRDSVDDYHVKHTLEFIDETRKRNADQPFFVYLPLNAAHGATLPPARFKGTTKDSARGDKCLWVNESVGKIFSALDERSIADAFLPMVKISTEHQGADPLWDLHGSTSPTFISTLSDRWFEHC